MSRRYCSRCKALREQVAEDLPWCKRVRLCKLVDPNLIDRYPNETLHAYTERARSIEMGYVRAGATLAGRAFPTAGAELLALAVEMHALIFGQGDPDIAGKIRRTPVSFGRGGNQQHGAAAHAITERMEAFSVWELPRERNNAARWGASFLQRFFLVHPFTDGNGRVARLLMIRAIEYNGTLALRETPERGSRKYLHALEYAHRHDPRVGRFAMAGDNLRWLTEWLLCRIQDVSLDDDAELLDTAAGQAAPHPHPLKDRSSDD